MSLKKILSLALLACGLTVGASALPAPASPFAGSWSGSFVNSLGNGGTLEVTIHQAGNLRGTALLTSGLQATIRGHVDSRGRLHAVLHSAPAVISLRRPGRARQRADPRHLRAHEQRSHRRLYPLAGTVGDQEPGAIHFLARRALLTG